MADAGQLRPGSAPAAKALTTAEEPAKFQPAAAAMASNAAAQVSPPSPVPVPAQTPLTADPPPLNTSWSADATHGGTGAVVPAHYETAAALRRRTSAVGGPEGREQSVHCDARSPAATGGHVLSLGVVAGLGRPAAAVSLPLQGGRGRESQLCPPLRGHRGGAVAGDVGGFAAGRDVDGRAEVGLAGGAGPSDRQSDTLTRPAILFCLSMPVRPCQMLAGEHSVNGMYGEPRSTGVLLRSVALRYRRAGRWPGEGWNRGIFRFPGGKPAGKASGKEETGAHPPRNGEAWRPSFSSPGSRWEVANWPNWPAWRTARKRVHWSERLNRRYDAEGSAFRVEEVAGGFQLMTRAEICALAAATASHTRRNPIVPAGLGDLGRGGLSAARAASRDRGDPRRAVRRDPPPTRRARPGADCRGEVRNWGDPCCMQRRCGFFRSSGSAI